MRESPNNYNTSLTHKNIPSKIEHKRHSVKIENPRSSWTMALSRSIITQAIHHQPPIKAKYNNYFVLRGRAPPRYVSSVHVRTVSNFDGKFLLHRRRYTNAALKNAGKKIMWALSFCSDKLIYFPRGCKAQSPPMTPKRGSPVFEFTITISSGIFHSISCRYVAMSSAEWKFKNWGDADKLQMFTKYLQINLNIYSRLRRHFFWNLETSFDLGHSQWRFWFFW